MSRDSADSRPSDPYRHLMGIVSEAVLVLDARTLEVCEANDRASEVLGIPVERLRGSHLERLVGTASADPVDLEPLRPSTDREKPVTLTIGGGEGSTRLELESTTAEIAGDRRCLVLVREVTGEGDRSAGHRGGRGPSETAAGEAPVCQATIAADGRVEWAEGRGFELVGLDPAAMIGEHYGTAFDEVPDARRAIAAAIEGGTVVQRTVDFGDVAIELWLRPVQAGRRTTVLVTGMEVSAMKGTKDRIQALAEATREFQYADRKSEVASVAVEIADDVLGYSPVTYYEYDPDRDRLEPLVPDPPDGSSDAAESPADHRDRSGPGGGPGGTTCGADSRRGAESAGPGSWELSVFEAGESCWISGGDVHRGSDGADGILAVPLGDHGLFVAGDDGEEELGDEDRKLLETLCRAARSALDRIERDRELAEVQRGLETVVENAPVILFAFDDDGVFVQSRGAGLEHLGLDPGEAVGQSVYDLYADAPAVVDAFERARDGERVEELIHSHGRAFRTVYSPVEDDRSEEVAVCVGVDVTELRDHDGRTRESGAGLGDLFASADSDEAVRSLVALADAAFAGTGATLWERAPETGAFRPRAGRLADQERPSQAGATGASIEPESVPSGEPRVAETFPGSTDCGPTLLVPVGGRHVLTTGVDGQFGEDAAVMELARLLSLVGERILEAAGEAS